MDALGMGRRDLSASCTIQPKTAQDVGGIVCGVLEQGETLLGGTEGELGRHVEVAGGGRGGMQS